MSFGMHVNSWWPWAALATTEQVAELRRARASPRSCWPPTPTPSGPPARSSGTTSPTPRRRAEGWRAHRREGLRHLGRRGRRLLVRHPPGAPTRRLNAASLFYVDAAKGGWEITDEWRGMGLRGQQLGAHGLHRHRGAGRRRLLRRRVAAGDRLQADPRGAGADACARTSSAWPRRWSTTPGARQEPRAPEHRHAALAGRHGPGAGRRHADPGRRRRGR